MQVLEFLQLMERSAKLVITGRICGAIHAGSCIIGLVKGHCAIRNFTVVVYYLAKGIINLSKKPGSAAALNVLHGIVACFGAIFSEITNNVEWARARAVLMFALCAKRSGCKKTSQKQTSTSLVHRFLLNTLLAGKFSCRHRCNH